MPSPKSKQSTPTPRDNENRNASTLPAASSRRAPFGSLGEIGKACQPFIFKIIQNRTVIDKMIPLMPK